jgi:hypothetical protein
MGSAMSVLVQQFYQVPIKIIGQCINYKNYLSWEMIMAFVEARILNEVV